MSLSKSDRSVKSVISAKSWDTRGQGYIHQIREHFGMVVADCPMAGWWFDCVPLHSARDTMTEFSKVDLGLSLVINGN